jgi:type I restriction enzyme S subunit
VPADGLREAAVPLVPLVEQPRIIARIDAFFAEIAEGEAALAEARKGLDTFRRALLKAAVTGELTQDWRLVNPATETGDDLLARIAKERATKRSRGQGAADAARDSSLLPKLPDTWAWGLLKKWATFSLVANAAHSIILAIACGLTFESRMSSKTELTFPT